MTDRELAFTPAYELVKLVAGKKVSPVELTRLYLERIDRIDPQLNAYLTVTADEAMESAKAAEQAVMDGEELGPLHGVRSPSRTWRRRPASGRPSGLRSSRTTCRTSPRAWPNA